MLVAIDAVGIRGHGAAAVLCELLYWLPRVRPDWRWHLFLFERHLREFDDPPVNDSVIIETTGSGDGGIQRLWWIRKKLQARIKSIRADVVFSFANIGATNPCVPQVVFVQQMNAFFDEEMPTRYLIKRLRLRFMRRQILNGAKASCAAIVQTQAMYDRMLGVESKLKGRIHIIPSGYRTPSVSPQIRREKTALIQNSVRPRLIYVTHPSEHKNHLNLIRALPGIVNVFPDTSLLLTLEKSTPPNSRYADFVNQIVAAADSLGVAHHLVWMGILTADEVHYALSNCDLMVFPSLAESFGLGLVESLAAGCPVAASDLRYAHDVMEETASYFNPHDPKSICDVVISILSDNDPLSTKQAVDSMMKKYSYENIALQITNLFNSVTIPPKPPHMNPLN